MILPEDFEEAVARSKTLTKRPSNDALQKMYALYKQATLGDVSGNKPGMFDFIGLAKYEAWEKEKGKAKEQAMREYVELIDGLLK